VLPNDFGILLPDHDADPEREPPGECSGTHGLPGQQQFLVRKLPPEVILWYNDDMKTAISVPDDVFESADELAQQLGISRSELYSTAVAEYLAKFRSEDITARLNEVYADQDSSLAPEIRRAQARSIGASGW
jgi:predicted transcriptional regulator